MLDGLVYTLHPKFLSLLTSLEVEIVDGFEASLMH